MKKLFATFFILISLVSYSDDVEEIEYIGKLYKDKYYKESVSELKFFLNKYPNSKYYDNAQYLLSSSYYILGDYKEAKKHFEKLIVTEYKFPSYYYLSSIAIKESDEIGMEMYYEKITDSNKYKARLGFELGKYFDKKKNYEKAKLYFFKQLKDNGRYYEESVLRLGLINYKMKEYLSALAFLDEYTSIISKENKNLPYIVYLQGDLKHRMKLDESAINYYKKVLEEYPESKYSSKSAFGLVKIYAKRTEVENVKKNIGFISDLALKSEALIIYGDLLREKKEYTLALESYNLAKNLNSSDLINYKLAQSYILLKKYDAALESLKTLKGSDYNLQYYKYFVDIKYIQKKYNDIMGIIDELNSLTLERDDYKVIFSTVADAAYLINSYEIAYKQYEKLYIDYGNEEYIYKLLLLCIKNDKEERVDYLFSWYKQQFREEESYKEKLFSNVGEYYYNIGKLYKSANVFEEYLKEKSNDEMGRYLVQIYLNQKNYEKAILFLEKQKQSNENIYYLALAYRGKGDYLKGVGLFEKLLVTENRFEEKSYIQIITSYMIINEYEKLIDVSDRYINRGFNKNYILVLDNKGLAYIKLGLYSEALSLYGELELIEEQEDYAKFMKAEIYYNQKNYEKAEKLYEEIVNKFEYSKYRELSLYWLIKLTDEQGEKELTKDYIKLFINKYSKSKYMSDVMYITAYMYLSEDDIDGALEEFKKVYELTDNGEIREDIISKIEEIYFNLEKYEEVLKWSEKHVDLGNKYFWRGKAYINLSKEELAIEEYNKLLKIEDKKEQGLYLLGEYYLSKNRLEESKHNFRELSKLKISKYKDTALFNLGIIAEKENSYEEAILKFTRIFILYPNSELADLSLLKVAENKEKLNRNSEALEDYHKFYKKYKESEYYSVVLERLFVIYWNKDRKVEAKKFYDELKQVDSVRAKAYEGEMIGGTEDE